ncbi:MAG: hypothetical protein LBU32_28795 [Clostridiales bacterium]|jgi:hypothetical protein|nr:hypothetical protein [Clostridiales bacterium]
MSGTFSKRLAAIIPSMIMVLTASCGSSPSSPASQAPSVNQESDGPLESYGDPVSISWAVQASQVQVFHDGDTYAQNR